MQLSPDVSRTPGLSRPDTKETNRDRARESKTMPVGGEAITPRQCWAPPDMIKAVDLPPEVLKRLVLHAGQVAIREGEVVTVLGSILGPYPTGHFCRLPCQYSHDGSVLVLPDMAIAELFANGGCLDAFQYIAGTGGRSIAIASVVLPPPERSVRPSP